MTNTLLKPLGKKATMAAFVLPGVITFLYGIATVFLSAITTLPFIWFDVVDEGGLRLETVILFLIGLYLILFPIYSFVKSVKNSLPKWQEYLIFFNLLYPVFLYLLYKIYFFLTTNYFR